MINIFKRFNIFKNNDNNIDTKKLYNEIKEELKEELFPQIYKDVYNKLITDIDKNPQVYRNLIVENINDAPLSQRYSIKNTLNSEEMESNSNTLWDCVLNTSLKPESFRISYKLYYGKNLPLVERSKKCKSINKIPDILEKTYQEYKNITGNYPCSVSNNQNPILGICDLRLIYSYSFLDTEDLTIYRLEKNSSNKIYNIDVLLSLKSTVDKFLNDFPEIVY